MEKLTKIQSELKAPKSLRNDFGKYNYRSAENILEAVKPLLEKYNCSLVLSDEVEMLGARVYVKATATLTDNETKVRVIAQAFAREEESKKGMDASQVTGACSSYARKYALGGLFCIDDGKDADALNTSKQYTEDPNLELALQQVREANDMLTLEQVYRSWGAYARNSEFLNACSRRKEELNAK